MSKRQPVALGGAADAAHHRVGLEDGAGHTSFGQLVGGGEPGRAGADDDDARGGGGARRRRRCVGGAHEDVSLPRGCRRTRHCNQEAQRTRRTAGCATPQGAAATTIRFAAAPSTHCYHARLMRTLVSEGGGRRVRSAGRRRGRTRPPASLATRLAPLAVAGVVVMGVCLRFFTTSPLWLDEALSVNIARLPLGDMLDGAPPRRAPAALLPVAARLDGGRRRGRRRRPGPLGDHRRGHAAAGLHGRPADGRRSTAAGGPSWSWPVAVRASATPPRPACTPWSCCWCSVGYLLIDDALG